MTSETWQLFLFALQKLQTYSEDDAISTAPTIAELFDNPSVPDGQYLLRCSTLRNDVVVTYYDGDIQVSGYSERSIV